MNKPANRVGLTGWLRSLKWGANGFDRVLSVVLIGVILVCLGAIAYMASRPNQGEQFTEFYILGPDGKAADYPSELKVGQAAQVTAGIINNFRAPSTYRVEVIAGGVKDSEVGPIDLQPREKWEGEVDFVL
jgi:uncharacterized membrane protein